MKVKMILPALTEATSPYFRPVKYSLFPPLGLATLAGYLSDEDDVEINADDIARGLMFGEHALGQRIIGPRGNVQGFREEDVRGHFARFYGARNMIVCVAGPVEHDTVVEQARRYLGDLPVGAPAEPSPPS